MQKLNNLDGFLIKTLQDKKYLCLDDFISLCLTDKTYGYYVNENVIGKNADFITAPEVSQMFGEMLAIWALANFLANKEDFKNISILELGSGTGILMNDILRSFAILPELINKISNVNILDINKNLIAKQEQILLKHGFNINWQSSLQGFNFKENSLIVFANEFFDSLGTKQFRFKNGNFYEVVVKHNGSEFFLSTLDKKANIELNFLPNKKAEEGDILEISYNVIEQAKQLCALLKKQGGIALIVDYGYKENTFGDSIQAIYKHKSSNFLNNLGKSDITFHVNFNHIKQVAEQEGVVVSELKTQGDFLKEMGIFERYLKLSNNKSTKTKIQLAEDLHRLLDVNKMGGIFKVIALRYNINSVVCI